MINKLLLELPGLQDILEKKKEYIHNLDEKLLLSKGLNGVRIAPLKLRSIIYDNTSPILVQQFIQRFYRLPWYKNAAMLENTFNYTTEQIKTIFSRTSFYTLLVHAPNRLFDYVTEVNQEEWEESNNKILHGFYLNISYKSDIPKALIKYNYYTIFEINNGKFIPIKKSNILKKDIIMIQPPTDVENNLRTIFLSDTTTEIGDDIIALLKENLNLPDEPQTIKKAFVNNNAFINTQERAGLFGNLLTSISIPELNFMVNSIIYPIYFTEDLDRQKEFLLDITKNAIEKLKERIKEIISYLNDGTDDKLILPLVDMANIAAGRAFIKKKVNESHKYYTVSEKLNFIIDFITRYNQINFGVEMLILKKDQKLKSEICIQKLEEYEEHLEKVINSFFDEIEDLNNKFKSLES